MISELRDIQRLLYVEPNRRQEFIDVMARDGAVTDFRSEIYSRRADVIWITENARAVRDATRQLMYYEGTVKVIDP